MLQCVALCCSVLQCVVLQWVAKSPVMSPILIFEQRTIYYTMCPEYYEKSHVCEGGHYRMSASSDYDVRISKKPYILSEEPYIIMRPILYQMFNYENILMASSRRCVYVCICACVHVCVCVNKCVCVCVCVTANRARVCDLQ